MTVIIARYVPRTIPVAKISFSFQLSGKGDGLTLSLEIVMIVPAIFFIADMRTDTFTRNEVEILGEKRHRKHTIIENGNDKDHEGCKIEFPDQSNKQESKLQRLIDVRMERK
jgi:hypothetical protein